MVNLLETLYVVTGLSIIVSVIAWFRSRARAARAFAILAGGSALVSVALYRYLTP